MFSMQCASFTELAQSARLHALESNQHQDNKYTSFFNSAPSTLSTQKRRMSSEIKGAQLLLQALTQCRQMPSVGMYTSWRHWENEKVELLALATTVEGKFFISVLLRRRYSEVLYKKEKKHFLLAKKKKKSWSWMTRVMSLYQLSELLSCTLKYTFLWLNPSHKYSL